MKTFGLIVAFLLVATANGGIVPDDNDEDIDVCFLKYMTLAQSECKTLELWPWTYAIQFYINLNRMHNESASEQAFTAFYADFCSTKLDLNDCFNEKIKPQLSDCASNSGPMQDIFDVIIYFSSILKHICANNAHYMTEMLKGDGLMCMNKLNEVKCPSRAMVPDQSPICRMCEKRINCRPYYTECENKNTVDIWIDVHVAAQKAMGC